MPSSADANALRGRGFVSTGGAKKLSKGNQATLFTSGPFTVTETCMAGGGGASQVRIDVRSTESGSSLDGSQGTSRTIDSSPATTAHMQLKRTVALAAPSGATLDFVLQYGVNGIGANCWAAGFGFS